MAGLASIAAFGPVAGEHLAWMEREAARNPRWWNRARAQLRPNDSDQRTS